MQASHLHQSTTAKQILFLKVKMLLQCVMKWKEKLQGKLVTQEWQVFKAQVLH